jgi:hypothetical protein
LPILYDPCILPTIVMPLSTWFIAAILWVKSIPQSVYRNESKCGIAVFFKIIIELKCYICDCSTYY